MSYYDLHGTTQSRFDFSSGDSYIESFLDGDGKKRLYGFDDTGRYQLSTVFGTHFYESRLASFSTTSVTLITVHSLTVTNVPAGTYRVGSSFTVVSTKKCYTENVLLINAVRYRRNRISMPEQDIEYASSGENFITFTSASNNVLVELQSSTTAGATITTNNMVISFWRVS